MRWLLPLIQGRLESEDIDEKSMEYNARCMNSKAFSVCVRLNSRGPCFANWAARQRENQAS